MIPFDYDMFGFLWTTATVLFASKPKLRKNTKPIPLRYQRKILDDSELTEQQKRYIAPLDSQLAVLGFLPFYTFQVTNFGSNLIRGYQNPADPASCTVTIVEVQTNVNGLIAVNNSQVVNFTTRLAGERQLVTRNMELKTVLDTPAYKIMQECPHVTNLVTLKGIHDRKLTSLGPPLSPPRDVKSVITEAEEDHERFCNYQLQQGTYKLSSEGDRYLVTDKAFNRGIRNFFDPFARRISITTMLFSALVGAVLPLVGILKLGPAIADRFGSTRSLFLQPATTAILLCYILAGAMIGFIAESQAYLWVFLITYVPAHLVAGWSFGDLPYSTIAFTVSYFVCQAKRKRHLIFANDTQQKF